jgi:hypothetical protein
MTMSIGLPVGPSPLQEVRRRPLTIGGQIVTPIVYFTITSNANVAFQVRPSITIDLPYDASQLAPYRYVGYYDPTASPQPGWVVIEAAAPASANALSFDGPGRISYTASVPYYYAPFAVSSPLPIQTPTPALSADPGALAFPLNSSYGPQDVMITGGAPPYSSSVADTTIAQAMVSGSTMTVRPVLNAQTGQYNPGSTVITVSDAQQSHVTVQVGVTTSAVIIEARRKKR